MTIKTGTIANKFVVNAVEVGPVLPVITPDEVKWETKGKIEARGIGADHLIDLRGNRFFSTVYLAYNRHYPLTLAPDHVWLAIAQGFSHHVNENTEALRKNFVDHEGKQKIVIDVPPGKGDPFYPWVEAANTPFMEKSVLDTFIDKIKGLVKGEIVETIMPTFSTTTIHSHAAMAVTTMSTFKAYFEYGMRTLCGIPEVRLLGSVEDWRQVRERAGRLAAYDTEFWLPHLLPVLDKFVESAEGNPDKGFWDQIIKVGGGSGGPYVSGWINTLFPYMSGKRDNPRYQNRYMDWKNGQSWSGNNPGDYDASTVLVPVEWNYNGAIFNMEFEAGVIGASQDPATKAVQPEIGWAVADVTKN